MILWNENNQNTRFSCLNAADKWQCDRARLTQFCERNLPEWPYIEGIQRKSLRDIIFREVCLNLLIHSEYGSRHSSTFTIWSDRVEIVNWNIPYGYGQVTLENFHPYAKNPVIANFFLQLGAVDEVGKGIRTLFKYVPLISAGRIPVIEEHDEFKVTIPFLMAGPAAEVKENSTEKTTEKILLLIRENPSITTEELAAACGLTADGIFYQIRKLKQQGILTREGGRKEGRWNVKLSGETEK